MSEIASTPGISAPSGTSADPCPTPLAWQEVVACFEREAEPFAFESREVDLEGQMIGEGPPLWFVGGFTGDRTQFALLAWLLKERFRCVLWDHHWRTRPAPQDFARLLGSAVLAAAGGQPISLFATSFGSQIALSNMARMPELCAAAIIHAGFARRQYTMSERLLARLGNWSSRRVGELKSWQQIQESNHRTWFPPIDPGRWEFLRDNLASTPIDELSLKVRAVAASDVGESLEKITTPVQLIRTEGDGRILSKAMDELAERLPNVRVESLHTTGHFAHVSHPHRVAKVVKAFLEDVGVAKPD
jgi:pimeloyl-ACP methyl ester carboxylesterase